MKRACALACLLWLVGCTTFREPTSPYLLTDDDINKVTAGIHAALKTDIDAPRFRSFKAAKSADGKIYVCGWLSSKDDHGAYGDEQPFLGSLFAGQFLFERLGRRSEDRDQIFAECFERGIKM
jgi:hypothetical protein